MKEAAFSVPKITKDWSMRNEASRQPGFEEQTIIQHRIAGMRLVAPSDVFRHQPVPTIEQAGSSNSGDSNRPSHVARGSACDGELWWCLMRLT
jgi:hypothetical protein